MQVAACHECLFNDFHICMGCKGHHSAGKNVQLCMLRLDDDKVQLSTEAVMAFCRLAAAK